MEALLGGREGERAGERKDGRRELDAHLVECMHGSKRGGARTGGRGRLLNSSGLDRPRKGEKGTDCLTFSKTRVNFLRLSLAKCITVIQRCK